MGVKFQGSFSSGTYFRTKVSNITSRVNCQSNSSKGRYTRRCVLIRIPEEILSTYSWGSIFAFGLLALTSQGRVLAGVESNGHIGLKSEVGMSWSRVKSMVEYNSRSRDVVA